jgi:predicted amidophosphoribosyltransferase
MMGAPQATHHTPRHTPLRRPRATHPGYCPECGERVTPFAAGCALCGADLDPRRWQGPPSVTQRLSPRLLSGWRARSPRTAAQTGARMR